jgi:hypothetical protein
MTRDKLDQLTSCKYLKDEFGIKEDYSQLLRNLLIDAYYDGNLQTQDQFYIYVLRYIDGMDRIGVRIAHV